MSKYTIKWWQFTKRSHCPHSNQIGIYGDEINRVGWYRLQCSSCGKYLNGNVNLAQKTPETVWDECVSKVHRSLAYSNGYIEFDAVNPYREETE